MERTDIVRVAKDLEVSGLAIDSVLVGCCRRPAWYAIVEPLGGNPKGIISTGEFIRNGGELVFNQKGGGCKILSLDKLLRGIKVFNSRDGGFNPDRITVADCHRILQYALFGKLAHPNVVEAHTRNNRIIESVATRA